MRNRSTLSRIVGLMFVSITFMASRLDIPYVNNIAIFAFYTFYIYIRNNYWFYFVCEGVLAIAAFFAITVTDYMLIYPSTMAFVGLGILYFLFVIYMDKHGYPILKNREE